MSSEVPHNDENQFSFDDVVQPHANTTFQVGQQHPSSLPLHPYHEGEWTVKDEIIDTVGTPIIEGIVSGFLHAIWWVITIPFRLIWAILTD